MIYCLRYLVVASRGVMPWSVVAHRPGRFLLWFSLCRGRMWRREVKRLVEKITCTSDEERVRFEEEGYVVVSVGYFPENGKPFYTMERGSDWSQKLGSK